MSTFSGGEVLVNIVRLVNDGIATLPFTYTVPTGRYAEISTVCVGQSSSIAYEIRFNGTANNLGEVRGTFAQDAVTNNVATLGAGDVFASTTAGNFQYVIIIKEYTTP